MAGTAKPRKKFRVAVSGNTVDGREIQPQHLRDAAANYNPEVYGARVNIEHYLSPFPAAILARWGMLWRSAPKILPKARWPVARLYAEIEPSERMVQMTDKGKKVYSSIELHPQFALNGKAYVVGWR
jgi:hypothetical protein